VDYTLLALLVAAVLVLAAANASVSRWEAQRHRARLALLERKLDAVLDHLGVAVPEPHVERVEELVRQGKSVEAVKSYREATGAGLLEAKQAVDRISGRG
jgi:ribosomal protein L7/L12